MSLRAVNGAPEQSGTLRAFAGSLWCAYDECPREEFRGHCHVGGVPNMGPVGMSRTGWEVS